MCPLKDLSFDGRPDGKRNADNGRDIHVEMVLSGHGSERWKQPIPRHYF